MQPARSMPEGETELADNELVRRYREGDAVAMETLLVRWDPPVRRLLFRLAAREHDVDDLCQEVFLRLFKATERYRYEWAFSTLLYRIVLSVARDAERRTRRRIRLSEALTTEPTGRESPPAVQAARHEAAELVAAALKSLPDELREPLVLRHYGNLTFEQAAEVLQLPKSTVQSRVQAALRTLRAELRKLGLNDNE